MPLTTENLRDMTTTERAVLIHLKGGVTVVYHEGRRVSPRFHDFAEARQWATDNGYKICCGTSLRCR